MRKLLILGGDSFVAKSFINYHTGDYDPVLVSRVTTGYAKEFVMEDLWKISALIFQDIDVVINCIGIVHQKAKVSKEMYDRVNYKLAVFLAKMARNEGVRHFIQMSTMAVYGNHMVVNKQTLPRPVDEYGASKYRADRELLEMQQESFLVTICRPPMIYGGENPPGNMMRLVKLVYNYRILPFKNINNKRDFLNIRNLVNYFEIIISQKMSGTLLLTDRDPISTSDLISMISRALSKNPKLVEIPRYLLGLIRCVFPGQMDKLYGSLDIESSSTQDKNEIFEPAFSVRDGIEEMVRWYLDGKNQDSE